MVWVKGGRRKNLELGALFNLELGKMNLELGIKIVFAISPFRYLSLGSFLDFSYANFLRRVKE